MLLKKINHRRFKIWKKLRLTPVIFRQFAYSSAGIGISVIALTYALSQNEIALLSFMLFGFIFVWPLGEEVIYKMWINENR